MAGNIIINGNNIDNILEPRTNTKLANLGIRRNGVDITNAFERGNSGTPAGNIGIRKDGNQVGPMFAAKGGVVYWDGSLGALPSNAGESGSGAANALVEILFDPNGTIRLRGNYPFRDGALGRWDGQAANSSNTRVRFVVTSGSLDTNGASTFSTLSQLRAFSISVFDSSKLTGVEVQLQNNTDSSSRISKAVSLSVSHGYIDGPEP